MCQPLQLGPISFPGDPPKFGDSARLLAHEKGDEFGQERSAVAARHFTDLLDLDEIQYIPIRGGRRNLVTH